ncbi:unnamed protein product, partial [Ectocarpus sp. 12 AP-2014]
MKCHAKSRVGMSQQQANHTSPRPIKFVIETKKVGLLKVEAVEDLAFTCMTWDTHNGRYQQALPVSRQIPPRVSYWRKRCHTLNLFGNPAVKAWKRLFTILDS